jgi:hypothetical protein
VIRTTLTIKSPVALPNHNTSEGSDDNHDTPMVTRARSWVGTPYVVACVAILMTGLLIDAIAWTVFRRTRRSATRAPALHAMYLLTCGPGHVEERTDYTAVGEEQLWCAWKDALARSDTEEAWVVIEGSPSEEENGTPTRSGYIRV